MVDDPYKTLGVAKDASSDDIRKAYRKLAKKFHPDLNPGNKTAEEKFKSISTANELLSDTEKRARYDRGEIDAGGTEKAPPRPSYRHYAESGPGERYAYSSSTAGFGAENFEDLFGTVFRDRTRPTRGADESYRLEVSFLDAVNGATSRLTLPEGQTVDVKIPAGTQAGDVLRLRQRGAPGQNGGPAGDALIEVAIAAHGFFERDGQDISLELPITLKEAVLGAKVPVPTPSGVVQMTVKPGTDSGARMRLRGRGVPASGAKAAGDLYVRMRVVLGPPDQALADFLRGWQPADPVNPRAVMDEAMGGDE